jgi:hypothetical protein
MSSIELTQNEKKWKNNKLIGQKVELILDGITVDNCNIEKIIIPNAIIENMSGSNINVSIPHDDKTMTEFPHTNNKINYELDDKEFILQKFHGKFRCISWHPHYIETLWYNAKEDAIAQADKIIEEFYDEYNAED